MSKQGLRAGLRAAGLSLSLLAAACGGVELIPRAEAPSAPTQGLTRCSIAASRTNPLVTEWPASEKANLEVRLREGAVAVAYSGCDMRIVPECHVGGGYQWLRTTVATDVIEIRNEDELYAKLPIGAVSLEGELRQSGRLAMQTTVTGQVRLTGVQANRVAESPECAQATHLLSSLSIGAFKLRSGGELKAGGGVDTPIGGAGLGTQSSERLLREAGTMERCSESTDQAAHPDCRSPIQMFLTPLPWTQRSDNVAEGTKRVEFTGGGSKLEWEVYEAGKPLCVTPCTRDVSAYSGFLMKQTDAGLKTFWPEVEVPPLAGETSAPLVTVRAMPSSMGLVLTGMVFTSLSGVAVAAGIPLAAVGFANDSEGLRNAGLITGSIGLAALVGSLWMLAAGRSHPEVIERGGLVVGPGFVRGSF